MPVERVGFAMQLNPGAEEEYRRRHDAIWPELSDLLRASGVSNYSIFLDARTNVLFAYLERAEGHAMDALGGTSGDAQMVGAYARHHAVPSRQFAGRDAARAKCFTCHDRVREADHERRGCGSRRRQDQRQARSCSTPAARRSGSARSRTIPCPGRPISTPTSKRSGLSSSARWAKRRRRIGSRRSCRRPTAPPPRWSTSAASRCRWSTMRTAASRRSNRTTRKSGRRSRAPIRRPPPTASMSGGSSAWQASLDPAAFACAKHLLFYPQYWAWRMSGVAASEATSLGCHTDLWLPAQTRPSSLVAALGLQGRIAPVLPAWASLGPCAGANSSRPTGLAPDVRVLCGVHDSNASIIPYLANWQAPFTVVSTGTWVILLGVGLPIDGLDPAADMLANVDITGRPTACARFMGGREYAEIARGDLGPPTRAAVAGLIERRVFAAPAFSAQGGPFAQRRGRIVGEVARFRTRRARLALCGLYDRPHAEAARRRARAGRGRRQSSAPTRPSGRSSRNCVGVRRWSRPAVPIGSAYGAAMLASWPDCPPLPETFHPSELGPRRVGGLSARMDRAGAGRRLIVGRRRIRLWFRRRDPGFGAGQSVLRAARISLERSREPPI